METKMCLSMLVCCVCISASCYAQQTTIKFVSAKDTLQSGEIYSRRIAVTLQPGDSIVKFEAKTWNAPVKTQKGTAEIKFVAFYSGPENTEQYVRKEIPLEVRLKTLRLDTIVRTKIVYHTSPSPAYVRYLSDNELHSQCEVYPEVKPKLLGFSGDIKGLLSKSVLKGLKGVLVFTFVIDKQGIVGNAKIHHNTYSVNEETILEVLKRTKWNAGNKNGKIVSTLVGGIIEKK